MIYKVTPPPEVASSAAVQSPISGDILAHKPAYPRIPVLAHLAHVLAHTRAYTRIPAYTHEYLRILADTRGYPGRQCAVALSRHSEYEYRHEKKNDSRVMISEPTDVGRSDSHPTTRAGVRLGSFRQAQPDMPTD